MTRRILFLFVAVTVLCSCMAVTVHAEGNDSGWIELLEYSSVQTDGDNWFTVPGTSGSVTIPVPQEKRLRKIDMLLYNPTGQRFSSATVTVGSTTTNLAIYGLGSNLTRIVGYMPNSWYTAITVNLSKSTTSSQTYEVLSCKVTPVGSQEFTADASVYCDYLDATYPTGMHINMGDGSLDSFSLSSYQIRVNVKDWQKYDSLTVWGSAERCSISSIRATYNTAGLPITVSYMSDEADQTWTDWTTVANGSVEHGYSLGLDLHSKVLYCVTIDLNGVDRTLTDPLYVYFNGTFDAYYSGTFNCQYVNGHVATAETSGVSTWLRFKDYMDTQFTGIKQSISSQTSTLKTAINDLRIAVQNGFTDVGGWFEQYFGATEHDQDAEEFQEQAQQQGDQIGELNNQLQETEKPALDQIQTDIDGYLDPYVVSNVSIQLGVLTGDSTILSMLMIALTITLVSYVLFGKR